MEDLFVLLYLIPIALIIVFIALVVKLVNTGRTARQAEDRVAMLELEVNRLTTRVNRLETEDGATKARKPLHEAEKDSADAAAAEAFLRPRYRGQAAKDIQPPAPAPHVPEKPISAPAESAPTTPIAPPPPKPTAPTVEPAAPLSPLGIPIFAPPIAAKVEPEQPSIAPDQPSISLEEKLGTNWLNKIGIVILVFGLSFFIALKLKTMGPGGRVVIGYAVSALLLGGGLLLEKRKNYRVFARAGIGGGWALGFFVTYAMYHIDAAKVLSSQGLDLVLMVLVAGGMVLHSLRYRSQVVTGLAFLLAYCTIGISEVTIFTLVAGALLTLGLVIVTARERWYELELVGLVTAYGVHFIWLQHVLPMGAQGHAFPEFLPSAALIVFYWLVFRLSYIWPREHDLREDQLSTLTAILASLGMLGLLKYQSAHPEWAFYALLALGTAEMAFAWFSRQRRRVAFIVLSTISSMLLLAAIPFRFSGGSWTLLWLLESEALFLSGVRLRERTFRILGLLAGICAACQIATSSFVPTLLFRLDHADAQRHAAVALTLAVAAIVYWLNAEVVRRRWMQAEIHSAEDLMLRVMSYLGMASAAAGIYLFFPNAQTTVAWMALVLAAGLIADRLNEIDLSWQADLLAIGVVARALLINLNAENRSYGLTHRAISIGVTCAALYLCTKRKNAAAVSPILYSTAASALLALLAWYELHPVSVAVAWGVEGLLLFELGLMRRRTYLRWQGYVLLGASFVRIFFANLNVDSPSFFGPRLYTVLPLAAAYFWVYERLHAEDENSRESYVGQLAAWTGTAALSVCAYFEVLPNGVILAWGMIALALATVAWLAKRRVFLGQALVLAVAVLVRASLFNIFGATAPGEAFWDRRGVCVGISALLLFATLPIAFRLRDRLTVEANWYRKVLARPEQTLFFAPLLALTLLVSVEMRAGMITVAWSALGVLVFLFALLVKERSYRLSGLGLLLLGVGKILIIDVWKLDPTDRYVTLIVMGVALLLVSFLYTRYRETLLKFL